jgi:hypothetical protein
LQSKLALAAVAMWLGTSAASAQGFPAPLPGQQAAPAAGASSSPFPPVNGAAPQASFGAQSSFPSQGAAPLAGAPMGSAGPAAGGPPAGGSDCEKGFVPLKAEAEKRGKAIKAASDRKAPPDEACKLIGAYAASELKLIKYVETNAEKCGIPAQVATQMKEGHKNTDQMHKKVCEVAQQIRTRGPAGPSLSEALGSAGAIPEANVKRKGGSTFDTLNGNVLTR